MPENYDDLIVEMRQDPEPAAAAPQDNPLSKEAFAAKKKAERESLSELANRTELSVVADGGTFQKYLDTLARFERYSAQNTLLIFAQRPDATHIGDYDHWKEAGTPVSKGAVGIAIFEPGKEYLREDGTAGVRMNIKKVFDVSQTAARNKLSPEAARDIRTLLKALMSHSSTPIQLVDSLREGTGARYSEQHNVIEVVRGLDGGSLFRCLAQEIAYATLNHQNANDLPVSDKGFIAYAASYALCVKHGIEAKGYDFSEVKSHFAGRDGREVRGKIKTIRDTVNDMSTHMARLLNPPEKKSPSQEVRS